MKNIIIFSILIFFSGSVLAEWTKIDDFVGDGRNVFINKDQIKRSGDRVTMWTLTNYAGPREANDHEHLSTTELNEYDCKTAQYRTLALYWFSERDAEGDAFYEETAPGEMRPILPDTNEAEARKIACGQK